MQAELEQTLVEWDAATARAEDTDNWDEVVEIEARLRALGYEPG